MQILQKNICRKPALAGPQAVCNDLIDANYAQVGSYTLVLPGTETFPEPAVGKYNC